jgi:hypothetical protein
MIANIHVLVKSSANQNNSRIYKTFNQKLICELI